MKWCVLLMGITLRLRQNGRYFPDTIFKRVFLNENVWNSIKVSLKFVPKGPNNNIPALVQIMAWRRPGDKPLSEPVMFSSLTHICITWLQWVIQCFVHYSLPHNISTLLCCILLCCQGVRPGIHCRRRRQASTSPVNTRALILKTFQFLRLFLYEYWRQSCDTFTPIRQGY